MLNEKLSLVTVHFNSGISYTKICNVKTAIRFSKKGKTMHNFLYKCVKCKENKGSLYLSIVNVSKKY